MKLLDFLRSPLQTILRLRQARHRAQAARTIRILLKEMDPDHRPDLPPEALQEWLARLPAQLGIRHALKAAAAPYLATLGSRDFKLRMAICVILLASLRPFAQQRRQPLPTLACWASLFRAVAVPGPVLLVCMPPALLVLPDLGFNRVRFQTLREMINDLDDPECDSKYIGYPPLVGSGWNTTNPRVQVIPFNIHTPELLAQLKARVRVRA